MKKVGCKWRAIGIITPRRRNQNGVKSVTSDSHFESTHTNQLTTGSRWQDCGLNLLSTRLEMRKNKTSTIQRTLLERVAAWTPRYNLLGPEGHAQSTQLPFYIVAFERFALRKEKRDPALERRDQFSTAKTHSSQREARESHKYPP